jgi:hypothetical protein
LYTYFLLENNPRVKKRIALRPYLSPVLGAWYDVTVGLQLSSPVQAAPLSHCTGSRDFANMNI